MDFLAERVAATIERALPHGPCRLAGWSFGGTLAYAAALVLQRRGRVIQFVGLIDSRASYSAQPTLHETPSQRLLKKLQELSTAQPALSPSKTQWNAMQALTDQADFNSLWEYVRQFNLFENEAHRGLPCAQAKRFYERWDAHSVAAEGYQAPISKLRLHLYTALDEEETADDHVTQADLGPYLGWDAVVPASQIIQTSIPGDHQSMLSKDGALAAALNQHLLRLR